jgi:adenylate kinase family enzyme
MFLILRLQGRVDDNIETIRKRFRVFVESSLPVIEHYSSKDKVKKVLMLFYLTMETHMGITCTSA